MSVASAAAGCLADGKPAVVVTVSDAKGSAPRGAGTAMVVWADGFAGTIGGGQLEHQAMARARELLADGLPDSSLPSMEMALGPALGQCCGGRVSLSLRPLTRETLDDLQANESAAEAVLPLVALFGAGHVGTALAVALGPLPCRVLWIDDRAQQFPDDVPPLTETRLTRHPEMVVDALPAGTYVLVMSHSHDLDYGICEKALGRGDAAFVGLIGSASKRAQFANRLAAQGSDSALIEGLVCPIGVLGDSKPRDKSPAAIAALTAAQLLLLFDVKQ